MPAHLIDIYKDSALPTVITDDSLDILWSNDDEAVVGQSAASLFGRGAPLPDRSGAYYGAKNNIPYRYDVIRHESDKVYYIISRTSGNLFLDSLKNTSVSDYIMASASDTTEHLHNLCMITDALCDVLRKSGNDLEVSYTNEQMKCSYGLLGSVNLTKEILNYNAEIPSEIVSVTDCLREAESELLLMSKYSGCEIDVETEDKLFISANKDRLMFSLASAISAEVYRNGSAKEIHLRAFSTENKVTIAVNCGAPGTEFTSHSHRIYTDETSSESLELLVLRMFCDRFVGTLSHIFADNGSHSIILTFPKSGNAEHLRSAQKEIFTDNRFSPFRVFLASALNYNYYSE